ncbi:MAG TPA: SMP-30/gluconolactonase/LRE family protein [Longimicrobiales bacterium]|nr:SMP-30/gluconolactonase/LRE family protein [Longimicrobiales bacterium]
MSAPGTTYRRLSLAAALAALASALPGGLAAQVVRDAAGIFPDGAVAEVIFADGVFTEGPAMGPDGLLYFSDITSPARSGNQAGYIWRLDPATRHAEIWRSPSGMSNGLAWDGEGRLVAAMGANFGGRAIVRTDLRTGRSVFLAGLYNGRSLNSPNDLVLDAAGRVYFTDPRYVGHEPVEQPVEGVYRIDTDGSVTRIIDDAGKPNGVAVSPDGRTLYVASSEWPVRTGFNAVLAWDLGDDGSVSNIRTLIDFRPDAGPDGMAVDVDGNIYMARPSADPGVYVVSPGGDELAWLRLPDNPTNVAFGTGEHARTLFITAGPRVYAVPTSRSGFHPNSWSGARRQ